MGEYNLDYLEAIQKCIDGKGFIRGDGMADGMYVKNDKTLGMLVIIDGNNFHKKHMDLYISHGLLSQNWKLFPVANSRALIN